MANFEQIDDYLSNRLQEQDRKAFEQQLEGDPSLREEVDFQRQVIEGVRHARMAELKTMLKNVPVSGGNTWGSAKIAAAVVSAGILSTLIYLNVSEEKTASTEISKEPVTEVVTTPQNEAKASDETVVAKDNNTKDAVGESSDRTTAKEPAKKTTEETKVATPVHKPDINVIDPSNELSADEKKADAGLSSTGRAEISPSKMEVITGTEDKKHNFHYQFVQGKLMLYGPFDKSLYEILEIHGDGHAVFLYYKENYYLLDESQTKITQLQAIRDGDLLRKLKEYRGR